MLLSLNGDEQTESDAMGINTWPALPQRVSYTVSRPLIARVTARMMV
jgi:hypothetical protein